MKIDTANNTITAEGGMWLTNGETFSEEISLGRADRIENWDEITEEEYQEIMKERENEY
jgi:hypothetical protein